MMFGVISVDFGKVIEKEVIGYGAYELAYKMSWLIKVLWLHVSSDGNRTLSFHFSGLWLAPKTFYCYLNKHVRQQYIYGFLKTHIISNLGLGRRLD